MKTFVLRPPLSPFLNIHMYILQTTGAPGEQSYHTFINTYIYARMAYGCVRIHACVYARERE